MNKNETCSFEACMGFAAAVKFAVFDFACGKADCRS